MDYKEVWDNCLEVLKDNLSPTSFRTWFEPIVPIKLEDSVLTIQIPSAFFYEYLEEHFLDILKKTLQKELGPEAKLEYNVLMDNASIGHEARPGRSVIWPEKKKSGLINPPKPLPIDDNEDKWNPFVIPGIKKLRVDPQLNSMYSFENFVEGDCNRLARSASYAVANTPGGTTFNPLFIYGGSGLGKTHLAQAIGIEVKEKFPDKIVLYVNANKFQTQFTEAHLKKSRNDFVHFYQMIDVLIIDDVQDFAGKDATQDIFFHIFNHLHQSNKQLILTSDKPPVELQGMEQRLLSRFKWGLSADLNTPDYETRIAILKKKIHSDGTEVPQEVVEYIASHITNNIRELEGALISLLAQSTLNKHEINLELAKKMIDKLVKNTKRKISIDFISKVVCDYFNMPPETINSKTRKREIVQARQIAMFFAKNLTKSSLATIGSQIGGKDHATVLHAYKTVNNLMDTDKRFRQYIDEIEKKLKA